MLKNLNPHSLFWKLALPVVIFFAVIILALSFYISSEIEHRAVEGAKTAANQTATQFKKLRKYYVNNIIKKVKSASSIKPAINHKNNPNSIPLPATMIHDLSEELKNEGTTVSLYSAYPFPNRQSRVLDSFQKNAWDYLTKNPKKNYVQETVRDGKNIVRVAVADTMVAEGCVNCHNAHPDTPKTDWKLGDVRGVLEISNDITKQVVASTKTGQQIVIMLIVSLVLITTILYIIYNSVIARKIHGLNAAIATLAAGSTDLTQRLDDSGKDEVSVVAHSFNRFIASHQLFIKEIASAVQQLSDSSASLFNITTFAKESSRDQKSQIGNIATAVNQMGASIQEVALNTTQAEKTARAAEKETRTGKRVVDENVNIIKSLSLDFATAAEVTQTLKTDSEGIGAVLDVISSISEQTNLLALNAAIEAARAGEHGRGFAVVADEVRTLASRTRESTVEIQNMIERLQQGSDNAANAMSKGIETIKDSEKQATAIEEAFVAITDAVNEMLDYNTQIASASEEQSVVVEDIGKNIVTVDNLAKKGNDTAQRIVEENLQLENLASNLAKLTSRFKLN
ncbi:MAG TPA: methyl-accepting chemotaxis protein [Gammaproteobacteria bacterium]|nr:methyl-accepting chemotaxis protein [Gammaproteobacteria bacterium]